MKSLRFVILLLAMITLPAMAADAPPGDMFPAAATPPPANAPANAPAPAAPAPAPAASAPAPANAPAPAAPAPAAPAEKPKQTRQRKPKAEDAPPPPQVPEMSPDLGDMTPDYVRYRLEYFPDEAVPYYQGRRHRLSEELQAALDEAAE